MLPRSQGLYAGVHGPKKDVDNEDDKGNKGSMTNETGKAARLLTTAEVARHFGVTPTTIRRWVKIGALQAVRTMGGHRRFLPSVVKVEGAR